MTITFRNYVLDNLNNDLASLRLAESSGCWPYEGGELLNWRTMRMATPEEKKAVETKVDLDLKATQAALKSVGEEPLNPSLAKEFWNTERSFHIYSDILNQTLEEHKKYQEAMANSPNPEAYQKEVLDNMVQKKLGEWQSYNKRETTKTTHSGWGWGSQTATR